MNFADEIQSLIDRQIKEEEIIKAEEEIKRKEEYRILQIKFDEMEGFLSKPLADLEKLNYKVEKVFTKERFTPIKWVISKGDFGIEVITKWIVDVHESGPYHEGYGYEKTWYENLVVFFVSHKGLKTRTGLNTRFNTPKQVLEQIKSLIVEFEKEKSYEQ